MGVVQSDISAICSEHSCQHGASDLALMFCTCLKYVMVHAQKVIVAPPIILCAVTKQFLTFELLPRNLVGGASYYAIIFLDV